MCGCGLSRHELGVCWILSERFNATTYKNILENVMLPSVRHHFPENNFILQQDNCPVHNAQIIKEYFATNNVETMVWPAKC